MKYLSIEKGACTDVKSIAEPELETLAGEVREAILHRVSTVGGHVGPNLGFVEGTIALHRVFDPHKDRIVFDVSHQSYAHKILTGRAYAFVDDNHFGDITGYTNPLESDADVFVTGHTSTSISSALGLALARDRNHRGEKIIAVIGDGSLSGGEALEGLNIAGEYRGQLIIIVNDNAMSISENHGGMYRHLSELRRTSSACQNNIFRSFGLDYEYLPDGNDVHKFISALKKIENRNTPVILHVSTTKGMGYEPAVRDKEAFHYHPPFDISTAQPTLQMTDGIGKRTYDLLFSRIKQGEKLQVLNAATASTLAMSEDMRRSLGAVYLDVGIAEQSMVSVAAGLAKGAVLPIVSVYSTFLSRAYDQIFHDVCVNNLPVVFLVFSATVFGMKDVTHNGLFADVAISNFPNLDLYNPVNEKEYFSLLSSVLDTPPRSPIAIKVPENPAPSSANITDVRTRSGRVLRQGSDIAVIAAGDMLSIAEKVCDILSSHSVFARLISSSVTGCTLDEDFYRGVFADFEVAAVIDNSAFSSGFISKLSPLSGKCRIIPFAYKNQLSDMPASSDEFLSREHLEPSFISDEILRSL